MTAFIVATLQIYRWSKFDYGLKSDFLFSVSSFALGDFVGFIIMFPFFIMGYFFLVKRSKIEWSIITKCILFLIAILIFDTVLVIISPDMMYYAKSFAVIPLIWLAYKYDSFGALMAIVAFNLVIVASLIFNISHADILQDQIYIILISLTGMLIGASFSEQKLLYLQLENKVIERTAELQLANDKLEKISLTDPLTGLKNRRFLVNNLQNDIDLVLRKHKGSTLTNTNAALIDADLIFFLIDLDLFKQVNDEHGHTAGDLVLSQVKSILEQVFRETDYLVRWGGEEFLVIARFSERKNAPELAERLRHTVEQYNFDIGQGVSINKTCSIGFASYPFLTKRPDYLNWERVIDITDHCLYAAKKSGRNAWVGLSNINCAEENLFANVIKNTKSLIDSQQLLVQTSINKETKITWD
jgi:diguanylate cyclase (GGDEF)-like protein